jgi:hypothetical protein
MTNGKRFEFEYLNLGFVSNFDIRISDLKSTHKFQISLGRLMAGQQACLPVERKNPHDE